MLPRAAQMYIPISDTDLDHLRREAGIAAARLVRQFRLPHHERDDLRQDLLVDLIARLKSFESARGTLRAFAGTVVAHQARRLADRIRRERMVFALVSLDDPLPDSDGATVGDMIAEADGYAALLGQPTDRFAEVERRLDLDRVLSTLPRSAVALCAALALRTPTEISRNGIGARATIYREVREIRLRLLTAGFSVPA
jgi:hypothetical protein